MFAHFAQETGEHNNSDKEVEEWRQGLAHLRELGCTDTSPGEWMKFVITPERRELGYL